MLTEIENIGIEIDSLIQRIQELSNNQLVSISIVSHWNKEKKIHIEFFSEEAININADNQGDLELIESSGDCSGIARTFKIEQILR